MTENEKLVFCKMIAAILQVHGRPANEDVLEVWWGVLKRWPMNSLRKALDVFMNKGGNPIPASIVKLLPDPLGHPLPEEAWNAAQKDEYTEGAYMSEEMLCAVCAASDSLERGDMIGARRCFIDVYSQKVQESNLEQRPACFRYFPPIAVREDQKREIEESALLGAVTRGWLSDDCGKNRLERIEFELPRIQWMPDADVKKITKQG